MKTVCIESPLAGDFAMNIAYARAALWYCLDQRVSPYASHLLLPQVYNDLTEPQRARGIEAGLVMGHLCDERWYFTDLNDGAYTEGMKRAAMAAPSLQKWRRVELGKDWATKIQLTPTPGFQ